MARRDRDGEADPAKPYGGGRELGGGHGSGGSAGARGHAVSSGAPDCGRFVLESVRSGKTPADWSAEEMQQFGIPSLNCWNAQWNAVARSAGRHRTQCRGGALAAAKQRLNEMTV